MAGIEFLEPTGTTDPPGAPSAPPPPPLGATPSALLRWVAAALWSAAAVLVLIAAYQPLLRVSYAGGPGSYTLDAWGRYSGGGASYSVLHGPRYGPVLCGAAVVLAVLAGAALLRALDRGSQLVRIATGIGGLVAVGFLGGLTAAMVLQITSVLDSERASVHRAGGLGDPVNGDVHTTIGAGVAFAAAALACAALAAGLSAVAGLPIVHRFLSRTNALATRSR